MDILILVINIIILLLVIPNLPLLFQIANEVSSKTKKPPVQEEPKVTDPFTKPKEIYSSTNHIVVPKTPTEIRNQNFKKIQEGLEYGDIKRE